MQAQDVMTAKVVTVRPDTHIAGIVRLLLERNTSAVPVVDENDGLLGIVSEGDLMRALKTRPNAIRRGGWGCYVNRPIAPVIMSKATACSRLM
jgi:CBS domain-containing protein